MGRKNKQIILEKVEMTDIGAEGKALGKYEDKVVFAPGLVPGDVADIRVKRKRRNYYEGIALDIHTYSNMRIQPFCSHFGTCGGCKWQHLPYDKQLFYKQKEVENNLKRIGKVEDAKVLPVVPSEKTRYYRNKLEFTFSSSRWLEKEEIESGDEIERTDALGFHIPGRFDKVLDIRECYLQNDLSNQIRLELKSFARKQGYEFYNLREHTGFLRNLIIRNTSLGEWMVIVSFAENNPEQIEICMNHLSGKFPQITSLMYVVNTKKNDTINDLDIICHSGKDHIMEEMDVLRFKIGPKSFFQTNSEQAVQLYRKAVEFAGFKGDEIVYDLYTGTGTIANFIAEKVKKVIGIEYIPEATEDANENARINNIKNTQFFAGDMKDILNEKFILENGRPDVIITDPPRAGMHTDVIEAILRSGAEKIVYVSCNSATQARDIELLSEYYKTIQYQPVDMFPHTHHIENVALLVRK